MLFIVTFFMLVGPGIVDFIYDNVGETQVSLPTLMLDDDLVEETAINITAVVRLEEYKGDCV